MSRLVFLVCHLSGTGHFVRTLQLARVAQRRGHEVTVISGGRPLEHLDTSDIAVVQLPPVTVAGLDFTTLRLPDGRIAAPHYLAERATALRTAIAHARPHILVTELYPFGRRILAHEFREAIQTARDSSAQTMVACSIRDIPEPKPKRLTEVAAILTDHYDCVLVHGDPAFVPLSETWPLQGANLPQIFHTGYVLRPPHTPAAESPGILVSAGGGNLGRDLLALATKAAALSQHPWLVIFGGPDAAEIATASEGPANLTVCPPRPDYQTLLASADCSISLCGYNTAIDLAQVSAPALLVPSEEAGEKEQLIRAQRLASFPGVSLMRLHDLTPEALAQAAGTAARAPRRPLIPLVGDDGTGAIVRLETMLDARKTP